MRRDLAKHLSRAAAAALRSRSAANPPRRNAFTASLIEDAGKLTFGREGPSLTCGLNRAYAGRGVSVKDKALHNLKPVDLQKNGATTVGNSILAKEHLRWHMMGSSSTNQFSKHNGKHCQTPCLARTSASYSTQASKRTPQEEVRKDISTVEDPFDAPTYNIPEKPMTFTEGASYSFVILAGLGIAGLAGYAVVKELIFEPKEYKIFGKALGRVQKDSQVTVRIGSPVTGYGSESRNRAARQRIPNRVWTDEDGIEHVEVNFFIRGPHGSGKVYAEMFKDESERTWKFTYLIVEITSPTRAQLMLESYVPA